jgi:transcriptional regulator with XRE-family HTH domain
MEGNDVIVSRITELSKEFDIAPTQALKQSGAGKDFIANLKKGQKPSYEKIVLISKYFHVTTDYLLGITDNKEKVEPDAQTRLDYVLDLFDKLPEANKDVFIEEVKKRVNNKKK